MKKTSCLKNRSLAFLILGFLLLYYPSYNSSADTIPDIIDTISPCSDTEEWGLDRGTGADPQIKTIKENNRTVLEVTFDLQLPDFSAKKLYSGFSMALAGTDFTLEKNNALAFTLLWEGGENYFKIELEDNDGYLKAVHLFDLFKKQGWQTVYVTQNDLENVNNKIKPVFNGPIKKITVSLFYSWSTGPGRILLGGVYLVKKPGQKAPIIGLSQLGYTPEENKQIIIRWEQPDELSGTFQIMQLPAGQIVLEKELVRPAFTKWSGQFLTGNFSEIKEPGQYQALITINNKKFYSDTFLIEQHIYENRTSKIVIDFFKALRSDDPASCGFPELGGYRDTGTMYARYLNTNPHALYGISTYLLSHDIPATYKNKIRYFLNELQYGVRSMLAWQKEDGSVTAAIIRDPDLYLHNQLPEENNYPWKLDNPVNAPLEYIAAVACASRALKPYDPVLAGKALAAAEKSLLKAESSREITVNSTGQGNYLWALMELYKTTYNKKYYDKAVQIAVKLINRQFLDYFRVPERVCGNISGSSRSLDFSFQYKLIHSAGIYLGLIGLFQEMKVSDPLYPELRYCLKIFADQYLLKMSSLTPYKEIAEGLEQNNDGTFHVSYFHPATGRLGTQSHGLNCDHLAYALMGLRLSSLLNEPQLRLFAAEQLQWIFGVNPLGKSMMTGIGHDTAESLDEFIGLKPIYGGVMNGIIGHNGTEPFWAKHWISGEYWLPHNSYYIAVIGELENSSPDRSKKQDRGILAKITLPEKIEASKDIQALVTLKNVNKKNESISLKIWARGSFQCNNSQKITLAPEEIKKVEITLALTGKRAPATITVACNDQIITEKMFLPLLMPFKLPDYGPVTQIIPVAVTASSIQKNENDVKAEYCIDNIPTTRWSSEFKDPQWLIFDLGKNIPLKRIIIQWESAFAEQYEVQSSADGKKWKTVYQADDEDGALDEIIFSKPVEARYFRFTGKKRGTMYGYSIYEFQFFAVK